MPSPFSGMDPYLEEPGLWPDVHHQLISTAREFLSARLRPRYYVRVEERVFISDENDPGRSVIIPELRIAARPGSTGSLQPAASDGPGRDVAVAEPVVATTLIEDEIHEPRIEVIDRDQRLVVTVIEILSPANKVAGARGQASYQEKRLEVMRSPSHWVEIDLLRAGVPLAAREMLPPCEYTVHVSRVQRRPKATIWPIRLHQQLPVIPLPLRADDPDADLDLQAVLDTAYDRAGYDLQIDYRAEPVPPLTRELAEWSDHLLRQKNLR